MADTITPTSPTSPNKNKGHEPEEDLRQTVTDLKQDLTRLKESAMKAGSSKLHDLQDSAGETYEAGKEHVTDLLDRFSVTVRRNPMQSVLIAAGLGILYGMINRRS